MYGCSEHSSGDYDYTIYDEPIPVTEAPRFPPRVNMADLMLKPDMDMMNKPGMDMMHRPGIEMMGKPMSDVMLPEMVKSSMPVRIINIAEIKIKSYTSNGF